MRHTIVVISLRGGVDGLNVLVPFREDAYFAARPTIAVEKPGARDGGLDLDGRFALHPALTPLWPLYADGRLAFVHAVGWPGENHSHFDVWDEIESGTTGAERLHSGWLARHLAATGGASRSPLAAVAFADTLPRLLSGDAGAVVMQNLAPTLVTADEASDRRMCQALRALYGSGRRGHEAAYAALDAWDAVRENLAHATVERRDSRYPPTRFGEHVRAVETLIAARVGLEAASVELYGFDTHVAQGGASGAMASRLSELAECIAAFAASPVVPLERSTLVVMTEFGRRVSENGGAGTDHGKGSVMMLLGARVRGGRVYGEWPGLSPESLSGPGDLAATTDLRDVLGEVVAAVAGDAAARAAFPGYRPRVRLGVAV